MSSQRSNSGSIKDQLCGVLFFMSKSSARAIETDAVLLLNGYGEQSSVHQRPRLSSVSSDASSSGAPNDVPGSSSAAQALQPLLRPGGKVTWSPSDLKFSSIKNRCGCLEALKRLDRFSSFSGTGCPSGLLLLSTTSSAELLQRHLSEATSPKVSPSLVEGGCPGEQRRLPPGRPGRRSVPR